nr:hypothetical protein CFP56_68788 [Quercus suber]
MYAPDMRTTPASLGDFFGLAARDFGHAFSTGVDVSSLGFDDVGDMLSRMLFVLDSSCWRPNERDDEGRLHTADKFVLRKS